jgi:DNA-binding LytR/AlgR family response regulator
MSFEHGSNMETGSGSLLDSVDVHIPNAVETVREELRPPTPPLVSRRGHAIAELEEKMQVGRTASIHEALPELQNLMGPKSARIAIKAKGKILLIDPADVIAVEAQGNYVLIQHATRSHMLRESISTMEEKLNLHGFVRIHRSVLVNAALVEEIQPWSTGEYVLRVRGGKEYTVTRTYKKNLQLLAQSWIGTDGFAAD